jgi:hypothetical protein
VKSLLDVLHFAFGCRHRQKSGVFTIKNRTYQVCLQCGREFEYSLARMRPVRSASASHSSRYTFEDRQSRRRSVSGWSRELASSA